MAMVPAALIGRRLTLADYEALPDDQDYEIIDGVLYVAPRARYGHQSVGARLAYLIFGYVEERKLGQVIPDSDLVIDARNTYVSPDLMYFSAEKYAAVDEDDWNSIVPDLAVEILSESTARRDLVAKRQLYAEIGVAHYWILDRGRRLVRECRLGADGQYAESVVAAPEQFRPALFPGLEIDLTYVFG